MLRLLLFCWHARHSLGLLFSFEGAMRGTWNCIHKAQKLSLPMQVIRAPARVPVNISLGHRQVGQLQPAPRGRDVGLAR
jgi:hypothetical protein